MTGPAAEFTGVSRTYAVPWRPHRSIEALCGVSFEVEQGEVFALWARIEPARPPCSRSCSAYAGPAADAFVGSATRSASVPRSPVSDTCTSTRHSRAISLPKHSSNHTVS